MPSPRSQARPSKIFISYRRAENAAHARLLSSQLGAHFGPRVIFIDIESIEPGRDFVEATENAISSCKILLVIIGPKWLTCVNERGRRLDDPEDFVRLEIAAALRQGVRVIPVLVQGATMPHAQDLPDEIAPLARRQAWNLADTSWNQDVKSLIEQIAGDIRPSGKRIPLKPLTAAAVFAVVLAGVYVSWPRLFTRRPEPPRSCPKSAAGESQYYEAEDAALSGGASRDLEHSGFSGGGFVSGYGGPTGVTTTFLADVQSDGQYQVELCYANGTNSAKTLTIYVNEERVKQTLLPNAPRWDIWLTQTESLPLRAGRNAISYRKSSSDNGQVNLDFIGVARGPAANASPQPAPTRAATATPTPAPSAPESPVRRPKAPTPQSTPCSAEDRLFGKC